MISRSKFSFERSVLKQKRQGPFIDLQTVVQDLLRDCQVDPGREIVRRTVPPIAVKRPARFNILLSTALPAKLGVAADRSLAAGACCPGSRAGTAARIAKFRFFRKRLPAVWTAFAQET